MTHKEALADLIAKVEAGEWPGTNILHKMNDSYGFDAWCAFEGSLAAAKALHEAVLPGWLYTIERVTGQTYRAWTNKARNLREMGFSERGPCPARAWLLVVLRALHSMEPNE